jgi:hypothetical protein
METKPTMEPSGSPVPGVIPGAIRVQPDTAGETAPLAAQTKER